MKNSRFQFEYRKNASKLHRKLGDLLRQDEIFCHHDIYQEYPVNKINKNYHNGSHKFDWAIPKLALVFECHGKQHYEATSFGGDVEDSISNFNDIKYRDKTKKLAAMDAGYTYVEIPYTEEKTLNIGKLLAMIEKGRSELQHYEKEKRIEEVINKQKFSVLEQQAKAAVEERKLKEKEWKRQRRQEYLNSKEHKIKLEAARKFRRERYLKIKEKKNGKVLDET